MKLAQHTSGITIIETLMIVSLCSVLISLAVVFFDPVGRMSISRNAERWNAVNSLAEALHAYRLKYEGVLPAGITSTLKEVCRATTTERTCTEGALDLSFLVPEFIAALPADPMHDGDGSGYGVFLTENGGIRVVALFPENGDVVAVTR